MLELVIDFLGRKKKSMGVGISGGGHRGPTRQGGVPWTLVARCLPPPAVFSVPKILTYSRKNHTKLAGHLENFYFRGIFILHG